MPRCLGKDYYFEDHAARRELSMRAVFAVPRCIKNEDDICTASHLLEVHERALQELKCTLVRFDVTNDTDSHQLDVQSSHKYECVVEPLEWATKWKNFDGNYVEIVPSSNPESNSSFCDSYPDSPHDNCCAEDFYTVSAGELSKGLDSSGHLEEPVLLPTLNLGDMSVITRLGGILVSVTSARDRGPSLNEQHTATTDETEETVFGDSDRQLDVPLTLHTADINVCKENFQQHVFEQAKAEELMCPLTCDELSPNLQRLSDCEVVNKAHTLCSTDQTISPLLPASDRCEKDAGIAEMKDLLMGQNSDEECNLESLILSPVAKSERSDFMGLNCAKDKEGLLYRSPEAGLESPLYLRSGPSPSSLHFASRNARVSSLLPWSQERISADSPFLSNRDTNRIQKKVWQGQAIFGSVLDLVFCEQKREINFAHAPKLFAKRSNFTRACNQPQEPEVNSQENQNPPQPNPVTAAFRLATKVHFGRHLGHLELDLNWDVAPISSKLLPLTCPETLTVIQDPRHESVKWKTPLDIESIEDIVEREVEKKHPTEVLSLKSNQTSSVNPVQLRRNQGEVCVDNGHLKPSKNAANEDRMSSISSAEFALMDIRTSSSNKTRNKMDPANVGNTVIPKPTVSSCNSDEQLSACFLVTHPLSQKPALTLTGATGEKEASLNLRQSVNQTTRDSQETERGLQFTAINKQRCSLFSDQKSNQSPATNKTVSPDSTYATVGPQRFSQVVQCAADKSSKSDDGGSCSVNKAADLPAIAGGTVKKKIDNGDLFTGIESKENTPDGFQLLLDDEDDILLGSDFFSDVGSSPADKPNTDTTRGSGGNIPFDPVDHFLMLRDAKTSSEGTFQGHSVVKAVPKLERRINNPHPGVITPMSVIPRSVGDGERRFETVVLSGLFLKALKDIVSQADPHLHRLKAEGVVSSDGTIMSLKPDFTRYLLKERINLPGREQQDLSQDETYKDILVVHTLRSAAHLLEHCCLESAIVHLSHAKDKCPAIAGTVEGLRKTLFQHQFTAQQTRLLHPKMAAVCREIQQHKKTTIVPHRVLVVVRHERPTVVTTLQSAISADGIRTRTAATETGDWPGECECLILWNQALVKSLVPSVTLIIEFEASNTDTQLSKACDADNVSYVGLSVVEEKHDLQGLGRHHLLTQPAGTVALSDNNSLTVVGSQQLIQHQQLLQLLESRHNVMVITRDYPSAGRVHYPDVLVDVVSGAVFVPVHQLRAEGGLETLMERLTAVGLHLSTIWVLVHCEGDLHSILFDQDTWKKLVQLNALVANLSASTKGFTAMYKVLLCRTAEQVALYVHHLATSSNVARHGALGSNTNISQIPTELTKEERFLLGIPCFNPFSCHLLLSRTSVGETLTMSCEQLRCLLPELPGNVIENFHRVVNMDRGVYLRQQEVDFSQPYNREEPALVNQLSHELDRSSQRGTSPCRDLDTSPFIFSRNVDEDEGGMDEDKAFPSGTQDPDPSLSCVRDSATADRSLKGEDLDVSSQINQQQYAGIPYNCYDTEGKRRRMVNRTPPKASHPPVERETLGEVLQGCEREIQWSVSADDACSGFVFNKQNQCNRNDDETRRINDTVRQNQKHASMSQHESFFSDSSPRFKGKELVSGFYRKLTRLGRTEYVSSSAFSDTNTTKWDRMETSSQPYLQRISIFPGSVHGHPIPVFSGNNAHRAVLPRRPHHYSVNDSDNVSDLSSLDKETGIPGNGRFSSPLSNGKISTNAMSRDNSTFFQDPRCHIFPAPTQANVKTAPFVVGSHGSFPRRDQENAYQTADNCLLPPRDISTDLSREIPQRESTVSFHRPAGDIAEQDMWLASGNVGQPISSFFPPSRQAGEARYPESMYHARESDQQAVDPNASSMGFIGFKTGCQSAKSNNQESAFARSAFRRTAIGTSDYERLSVEGSSGFGNFPAQPHESFANEPSGYCVPSVKYTRPDNSTANTSSAAATSNYHKPTSEPPASSCGWYSKDCDWSRTRRGQAFGDNIPPGSLSLLGDRYNTSECGPTDRAQVSTENSHTSGFRPSFNDDLAATTRRLLAGSAKSPGFVSRSSEHRSQLPTRTPLTPTHRINIGLATPIHRNPTGSQGSGGSEDVVSQQQPNVSHQTSSPPLDMDIDATSQDKQQRISATKLQKWCAQLQTKGKHHHNSNSEIYGEDMCPSPKKRRAVEDRKLTYQPVPGAGGQTRLTFI